MLHNQLSQKKTLLPQIEKYCLTPNKKKNSLKQEFISDMFLQILIYNNFKKVKRFYHISRNVLQIFETEKQKNVREAASGKL